MISVTHIVLPVPYSQAQLAEPQQHLGKVVHTVTAAAGCCCCR